jgi:hypothetical protein
MREKRIDTSPDALDCLPSLEALGVRLEILEAVEEIFSDSDVHGVERHKIECALRLAVHYSRRACGLVG